MEKSGEKLMAIQRTSSFKNQNNDVGALYLVPTPIGNLSDMTPRAIEVLSQVDYIASEDTRNTQKLLNHFEIHTKQISFHQHNTQERIPELITLMKNGSDIAQVSDAGMPSISDPGHELVEACIENNLRVIALPGPNAALTALIASGILPQPFIFYGFLPRKNAEQKKELEKLNQQTMTLIFYEAPHRLLKTLKNMALIFGEQRKITLCRELTKRYEEYLRGTLQDAIEWCEQDEVRGEFVLVIEGNEHPQTSNPESHLPLKQQVQNLIDNQGMKPNAAIKQVAKNNNLKKQIVYNEFHGID